MVVRLPTATPPMNALAAFPNMGNINTLAAVCLNCGNVRLHAEAVVSAPVRRPSPRPPRKPPSL